LSAPTKSNTLPAIRALLWERWRVMRWVIPASAVFYAASLLMWRFEGVQKDSSQHIEDMHTMMFPVIIVFGILGNCVNTRDGSNFRFGVPERTFLLPATNRFLMVTSLLTAHVFMLILTLALLLANALIWPQFPVPVDVVLISLLIGSVFIAGLQVWFTAAQNEFFTLPLFFLLPVVIVLAVGWMPTSVAIALAVGACIAAGTGGASVHALRRSGYLAGVYASLNVLRLIPMRRATLVPPLRSPTAMLVWHEWRRWGWVLAGLVLLTVLIPRAVHTVRPGMEIGNGGTTGWVLVILFAAGVGLVQTFQESRLGSSKPSNFFLLRPLPTRSLAFGRVVGTTSILLCASLIILCGTMLDPDPTPLGRSIGLACFLFGAAWVIAHAWVPLFFLTCVAQFFLLPIYIFLTAMMWRESADWGIVYMLMTVGLVLLFTIYMGVVVLMRRVVMLRVVVACVLVLIGIPWAIFARADDPALMLAAGDALLFLPIAAMGPMLWQVYWLHRCRHGGLGWRLGKGR